jgi:hypothetical protein
MSECSGPDCPECGGQSADEAFRVLGESPIETITKHLDEFKRVAAEREGGEVTFTDQDGQVLAHGRIKDDSTITIDNEAERKAIASAYAERRPVSVLLDGTAGAILAACSLSEFTVSDKLKREPPKWDPSADKLAALDAHERATYGKHRMAASSGRTECALGRRRKQARAAKASRKRNRR